MKLTESQMATMLENLPPAIRPRLDRRLSSAPWTPRGVKRRQTLTVIYVTTLLLAAFIGLTPQGRAFAQTIFKFFRTTDQSSFPLSQEDIDSLYTPAPTQALSLVSVTPLPLLPNGCDDPEDLYECEIQKMEKQVNMDLKEFSTSPSGWPFTKVESFTGISSGYKGTVITISYQTSGGGLSLSQGLGDFPPDQQVLSSAVERVNIGDYYGEYVDGGFGVGNGNIDVTWSAVAAEQRIRWKEGERWFELTAFSGPGTSGYLDKKALISLASDMVFQPDSSGRTTPVDMDTIPTIALAKRICGCDILQPTKLPENMSLDHIKYDPQWKSITVSYGYNSLRIIQTPHDSAMITSLDTYQDVEAVRVGEAEGQYGESPAQKTIWDSATPPAFPVSNTYRVLLWKTDTMVYQIYFDQSFNWGGQLTKEQLIEIAESLR